MVGILLFRNATLWTGVGACSHLCRCLRLPRGLWTRRAGCPRDLGPSYQLYRTPHGLGRVDKAGTGGSLSLVPGPQGRPPPLSGPGATEPADAPLSDQPRP